MKFTQSLIIAALFGILSGQDVEAISPGNLNNSMSDFDQEMFGALCQALADRKKDEIERVAPLVFKDIDTNGNGFLDKDEIRAFAGVISKDAEHTAAEMLVDLDYNNDGKIEVKEWSKFWFSKAGLE